MIKTHINKDDTTTRKGPWSSGYDISLTRRKSPVRIWVGPLIPILFLLVLTGCMYEDQTLEVTLQDSMIQSGEDTTLRVTVENAQNTTFTGTVTPHSESEKLSVTYPEPDNLDLILLPNEKVTRVFTVSAESDTRRTDYEITIQLHNETQQVTNQTNILSVVR